MSQVDVLYRNIGECVPLSDGPVSGSARGEALGRAEVLRDVAIAVREEKVVEIGPDRELARRYEPAEELDLSGFVVVPGFVDSHTHPVFGATREREFGMRCAGADYVEISKAGGGILSSVQSLRGSERSELAELVETRLRRHLALGTTTLEAKSGYGLSLDSELTSLQVLTEVAASLPLTVQRTFLGAHEVAPEYRDDPNAYVDLLCQEMLPACREWAEACDIFVESHVFGIEASRRICERAKDLGYRLRLHVDELTPLGGAELAVEVGADSADHLAQVSDRGIEMLAASNTTATLLPGTIFFLNKPQQAPGRRLVEAGAAVALATDYNPGSCPTQSMPMIATLARIAYGFSAAECLNAMTRNPAASLGLSEDCGTLHVGKAADFVALDIPSFEAFGYGFGDNCVAMTVKDGRPVALNSTEVSDQLLESFDEGGH